MENIFDKISRFWNKGIFYKFLIMAAILFMFGLSINGIVFLAGLL